jgi:hypothetical protein
MQNPHCVKRSDEILQNQDEQMLKFLQEIGLSVEQLHDQSEIQMAHVPKAWQLGKPMVDEKHFDNNMQIRIFH